MNTFDFDELLRFSQGRRQEEHEDTIRLMVAGAKDVRQSTREEERRGIDYVATLRSGAEVLIDVKSRRAGCSTYWPDGIPDFSLEVWSVVENKVTGWTLSEAKETDLILFVFDESDCETCYLIPFQHLRMAFRRYIGEWVLKYKRAKQSTVDAQGRRWTSSCVFVPAPVVLDAIQEVCVGVLA